MKNFFFDYKRIWLQIQNWHYDELKNIDGDLILTLCWYMLMFVEMLVAFALLLLSALIPPLLIIEYIILKLIYLYPIWNLYNRTKQHGKAFVNHKVYKKLKKCYLPWKYAYSEFKERIVEIDLEYNGLKYNIGFWDFVEIYNLSLREILREKILKSKKMLNKNTGDKIKIKQEEKLNTSILYNTLLHDIEIQKNNKGE